MAKLIIEIQDKLFEYITKGKDLSEEQNDEMALSIANGTPIPQGLEPLITKLIEDAKEVENE